MAQIFDSIGQIFSSVEYLTFEYDDFYGVHNEFDRTEWRRLLRPFCNVKTLHIDEELVEGLSHILRLGDGGDPLEVLPELQELTYTGSSETGEAFAPLIGARQNAGRPVTLRLVRRPRSVIMHTRSSSQSSLESSSVISWDSKVAEAGSNIDT